MIEITFGGSNAPICHGSFSFHYCWCHLTLVGAGLTNPTLSDLVHAITFVNANGELQTISATDVNKKLINSAAGYLYLFDSELMAGAFGLMGIVVSIDLILDPMSVVYVDPKTKPLSKGAIIHRRRMPLILAIPRPHVPADDPDVKAFVKDASAYYCEWFYFALQDEVWINSWNKAKKPDPKTIMEDYPRAGAQFLEKMEEVMAQFQSDTIAKVSPFLQTLSSLSKASFGSPQYRPFHEIRHARLKARGGGKHLSWKCSSL